MKSNMVVLIIVITLFVDSFAAAPRGHYTVTGDTVKDNKTSRVWRRTVSDQPLSFDEANNYCSTLDGYVDATWRLPTKRELETLVDVRASSPAIDSTAFPSTPSYTFWTSTKNNLKENDRFIVDFANGETVTNLTKLYQSKPLDKHYVRCVR